MVLLTAGVNILAVKSLEDLRMKVPNSCGPVRPSALKSATVVLPGHEPVSVTRIAFAQVASFADHSDHGVQLAEQVVVVVWLVPS